MALLAKVKNALDWLQHGYLLVQIAVGIGVGKIAKAMLMSFSHISPIWVTPIWWLVSGLTIWLLVFFGNKRSSKKSIQEATGQDAPTTLVTTTSDPTFDAKEWFRLAYISPLTTEGEKNIRIIARRNQPDDREGFLARFIGVGLVAYLHDLTWAYIYKSQLLMLLEMNRKGGWMSLADAKIYYDQAVIAYPAIYSNYSYEQWLDFMKQRQLFIHHPSNMLEITIHGKDFLKYLTHWGNYPDARHG